MSVFIRNSSISGNRQGGFTLLEVLVALVIISIGLLGVAILQMTGLKNNHSSAYRSQASILAYQMLESMRANRKEADSGSYNIALADATPSSSSTIYNNDIINWRTALARLLPSGNGSINYTRATGIVRITIEWNDSRGSAETATARQFMMETQLCDPGGAACQ
ncbi:MAG: type IV pilus modification protein PilV [Candidatus Competibacter sp.]|nr:type IV pilus modification protein PilV [Candidatus Competibacter sp.]